MPDTPVLPAPKVLSQSLLGTPRPKPTRFKPGLILMLVFGSATFFAGALVYGLFLSPQAMKQNAQDDSGTANGNLPQFGTFPSGYAQVTGKGATARPLSGQKPLAPVQTLAAGDTSQPLRPLGQSQEPQETPEQIAADKAKDSGIFFQGTADPSLEASGQGGGQTGAQSPVLPGGAPSGALQGAGSPPAPSPGDDPSQQSEKTGFVANAAQGGQSDYTGTAEQSPISPYVVQAGAIIPAALLTAVNSDLPGDVTAQVTEDVYDSPTGDYLLIPQGSRLYGKYDSLISYAQTRALIVWNRIIFPNGKSIDLGGMIGTDPTGESGVQDQVNRHVLGLTAALAAAALVSIGPEIATNLGQSGGSSGNTNIYTTPAENLGENGNNLGQEFVSKELNRPNTITIRSGFPLDVLVNKDIVLTPYTQ